MLKGNLQLIIHSSNITNNKVLVIFNLKELSFSGKTSSVLGAGLMTWATVKVTFWDTITND